MRLGLTLFLFVVLMGCSAKPDGQGYIFEVHDKHILVIEKLAPEHVGKTWNEIFQDYRGRAIMFKTDETGWQIGQKINYWIEGPVAESYPEQARAKKIEVIEEKQGS